MALSPLLLSRIQFFWVIAWHILLPAFTIGLASYIAFLEGAHLITGREIYFRLSTFWTRIFSVSFGMGVVSGIVMPFQFGTNWSRYAYAVADVLSPMFAYEGLMAFFLEASFLGVLLFGRKLVPRWAHFVAACMVAFGTLLSAFWILAANSWMQTPRGAKMVDGRFIPEHWLDIVFNPSFPTRFGHMVTGCFVTTGFVVMGVAAGYLLRERFVPESRRMLSTTLWLLLALVPFQLVMGDASGLVVEKYQPTKLAAIEARWDTMARVPLELFAIPDEQQAVNHDVLEIPVLGSLILTHDPDGVVRGLKDFPRQDWPPVIIPFFSFRVMVGIGFLMLFVVLGGNLLRHRDRLYSNRLFLRLCNLCAPIGFVAIVAGWITTEVGRQPWTVYGMLRTADSVTPSLTGWDVVFTLVGYVAAYCIIFPAGGMLIARMVRQGPSAAEEEEEPVKSGRPKSAVRPVAEEAP